MKSNKEFFKSLYAMKLNWVIFIVMLLISIFTYQSYLIFILYGAIMVALSIWGFKQYLFDICVTGAVSIMTALEYAYNLGLISYYGNAFRYVSIICCILVIANFFLVRHNYKVFVLDVKDDNSSSITNLN